MTSPVYNVIKVPLEKIHANSYNPNAVAPPEMKLLELSIWEDGYTMPIVCYRLPNSDEYEIVDGYHRYTVMRTSERIREREDGMLPVVVIDKPISNRMASTIRHNRARGSHNIDLMHGRQLDTQAHRYGCRRAAAAETDNRHRCPVCRARFRRGVGGHR